MDKIAFADLTQDDVSQVIHYDCETGDFTWKVRPREWFKSDRACNAFNAARAGKPAGYRTEDGYIRIDVHGFCVRGHRLAWFYMHGVWPMEIDHIDGDRKNNSISNLRTVNRRENSRNRCIRSDNTSGYPGVYKTKNGHWAASINITEKRFFIGVFPEYADAMFARKIAEKCFGYHANHGREASIHG